MTKAILQGLLEGLIILVLWVALLQLLVVVTGGLADYERGLWQGALGITALDTLRKVFNRPQPK